MLSQLYWQWNLINFWFLRYWIIRHFFVFFLFLIFIISIFYFTWRLFIINRFWLLFNSYFELVINKVSFSHLFKETYQEASKEILGVLRHILDLDVAHKVIHYWHHIYPVAHILKYYLVICILLYSTQTHIFTLLFDFNWNLADFKDLIFNRIVINYFFCSWT